MSGHSVEKDAPRRRYATVEEGATTVDMADVVPPAEKDACDGCQKRPCVCETVVLPSAEKDAAPVVQWAHVLDDTGSADLYDTEAEARESLALVGGGLDRIETTTVVPFSVFPPAEQQRDVNRGLCPICRDVLRAREDSPDAPRECPRHGRPIPPASDPQ